MKRRPLSDNIFCETVFVCFVTAKLVNIRTRCLVVGELVKRRTIMDCWTLKSWLNIRVVVLSSSCTTVKRAWSLKSDGRPFPELSWISRYPKPVLKREHHSRHCLPLIVLSSKNSLRLRNDCAAFHPSLIIHQSDRKTNSVQSLQVLKFSFIVINLLLVTLA